MPGKAGRVRVKRECYTLCSFEGQTEKAFRVGSRHSSELSRIVSARPGNFRERVGNPGGLVPLPPEWHRREIRRIGLDEQSVSGHEPNQIVVGPLAERHDPAEGHVPSRVDRELGQPVRTGIAVHHSSDAGASGFTNDRACIVFRVSSMDNDGTAHLTRERDLRGKGRALGFAWRVVIVIVEAAFANGDSTVLQEFAKLRDIPARVKTRGVMRMDSSSGEDKPRISRGELGSNRGGLERLADADDPSRARIAGARDYRVAVAGERRVSEVGVAVDED